MNTNTELLARAEAEYARLYPKRNPNTITAVLELAKIARRLARK